MDSCWEKLLPQLGDGIQALGLEVSESQQRRLLDYLALIQKWNKVYNLTAITSPQEMLVKHLLDSLSIFPYIKGPKIADIGTGAGLPGIPLAICFPNFQFELIDCVRKKINFLQHVVTSMKVNHVKPWHCRVEAYQPQPLCDQVLSRAFASLGDFVAYAQPLCRSGGELIAMKGQVLDEELKALPSSIEVDRVESLAVPGLSSHQRHVVIMRVC